MDLGTVESDEDAPVEAQEGGEAAALAQQREQGGGADAVEQVADAVVGGDGAHAEQGAAVGVAAAVLHAALALEEEGGEQAGGGDGDGEERVGAGAGVGELVGDKPEGVDQGLQEGGDVAPGERGF